MTQPQNPPATGATPEPAAPPATTAPATGPTTDPAAAAMHTDAGKKALDELRQQNKALADQLKSLESLKSLEPLRGLADALGVKADGKSGKTDVEALTEQVAEMKRQQAAAELRALRLEVAGEKGLTPQQAARLVGDTREALDADADALKALFPGAPAGNGGPRTPAPDPSQGSRGNASDLQAQLADAQQKGDTRRSIQLKTQIAALKSQ